MCFIFCYNALNTSTPTPIIRIKGQTKFELLSWYSKCTFGESDDLISYHFHSKLTYGNCLNKNHQQL